MGRSRSVSRPPSPRKRTTSPSPRVRLPYRGSSQTRTRPASRGRPRSRSSTRSSSRSPSRRKHKHDHHGLFKSTAGLLAGIGIATVIAHKAWPKGVLYGGQEEWETKPHGKHHGERVVERRRVARNGDGAYYEEVSRGRRRLLDRRPCEHETVRRTMVRDDGRGALPMYDDRYYEPEKRRVVAQPVFAPR